MTTRLLSRLQHGHIFRLPGRIDCGYISANVLSRRELARRTSEVMHMKRAIEMPLAALLLVVLVCVIGTDCSHVEKVLALKNALDSPQ